MADEYKYVMVSPAGNEHPTNDESYRYRLLSQGYTEKGGDPSEEVPQAQSGQPETGEPKQEPKPQKASGKT